MPRVRFRTVRAKLVATTMLVFSLLFVVLGVAVDTSSRNALMSSVDIDLERRGLDFARMVARGPDAGGPPSPTQPLGSGPILVRSRMRTDPRNLDPEWIAPRAIPISAHSGQPNARTLAYDFEAFVESARGNPYFKTVVVDGAPRRLYSAPARIHGKIVGVVQVSNSLEGALSALDSQRSMLLRVVIPLALLLGAMASFFVVSRLLQPLRHVTSEAERIGKGGFGEKLAIQGDDEFANLVGTLNGMLSRLESVYQLEKDTNRRLEEAIEHQRRFTSDASHELKTPLSVIKVFLGLLKSSRRPAADEREILRGIDAGANRMASLIDDLLLLARTDGGVFDRKELLRVDQIVDEAIVACPFATVRTSISGPVPPIVSCCGDDLLRVFVNLIDNAAKHSGNSEPIAVAIESHEDEVRVVVEDHGVGIEPEHLPHLFERFYRTDRSRTSDTGGSGLGLAICDQIVKNHGGQISVASKLGVGTRFTVSLPRSNG